MRALNSSNAKTIDGDDVWSFISRLGKYQVYQISFNSLLTLTFAIPIVSGIFVGKSVDFRCASNFTSDVSTQNTTALLSSCSIQIIDNDTSTVVAEEKCTDYVFQGGNVHLSYISEWEMVCDEEALGQLPQTLTMAGMVVGAVILPQFGDTYGRKKLAMSSLFFIFATSLGIAFVQHFELLLFLKFLTGVFNQGFMVPMTVMVLEVLRTDMRTLASYISTFTWVLSMAIVGAIGYLLRDHDWRTLQIAYAAVSGGLLIVCGWFLDESLRWLLKNGRAKKAEAVMKKACRMSNKDYQKLLSHVLKLKEDSQGVEQEDSVELISPLDPQDEPVQTNQSTPPKQTMLALFKNRYMRKITFVMCYTWAIVSLTYYGLIMLSTSLAGNSYINFSIGAALDLPAGIFMAYCIQIFGRKRTLIVNLSITSIALVASILVESFASGRYSIMQTCFTMAGKFFAAGSFNLLWIYTPELNPTNLRNAGIGLASSSARVGAMFSPFFTLLARTAKWAPGALCSVGCFVAVILLTQLPETGKRELPQNIADIEDWFDDNQKMKAKKESSMDDVL